ncbi:MAG: M20/M25/M40 family metallo-hydrolase, partial [Phycisphaerales bacterium]
MRHTTSAAPALSIALALAASALANEITYDCSVVTNSSSVLQTLDLSAPFNGTLKGNYDAKTNPTGTLTLPGLFGGSGNNLIPYTASFVLAGDIDTQPTGGKFDGNYGVLAGIEVVRTLNDLGVVTEAPIEVAFWTNEEGSRFVPVMM